MKNANKSKNIFSSKIQYGYQKKVVSKNMLEIYTFSTFTYVRQTCFAYNFFGAFS
jgi:hypothetical protein